MGRIKKNNVEMTAIEQDTRSVSQSTTLQQRLVTTSQWQWGDNLP